MIGEHLWCYPATTGQKGTEMSEKSLIAAIEKSYKKLPPAERIAKVRKLSAKDDAFARATFPELYHEAFPRQAVGGGRSESVQYSGLSAKPR